MCVSHPQNVVSSVGRITSVDTVPFWREMARRRQQVPGGGGGGGGAILLQQLETYTETLAMNLHQLFTPPFDAVHENFGESSKHAASAPEPRCAGDFVT